MGKHADYRIGDLNLRVIDDLPYPLPDSNLADFAVEQTQPDFIYRFEQVTSIPAQTGRTTVVSQSESSMDMLDERGELVRAFFWKGGLYDIVLKLREKEGFLYYVSNAILAERFETGLGFVSLLGLETLFLRQGALLLHSSHINVGGKALLFSAPSGTGKSTQAALWAQHAGAEIINGDRTLLRERDGVWRAYGCPMCGTSGIHRQGDEPIHAIVMLSQSAENAVTRLTAGEAFQRLYPEITVPRWDRALVLRAMELLDALMARVPIYALACTPDERAVTALREAIGL